MKKILLVIIATAFVQFSFAQSRWSFGFLFEPGISGLTHRVEDTGQPDSVKFYFGPKYSYSIGGMTDLKFNNRFHLSTGINFKKMSFSLGQKREDMDTFMLNIFAQSDTSLLHIQKWTLIPSYYFISVPINLKYYLNPLKKTNIFFVAGLTINYLFEGNGIWINEYDYGTDANKWKQKPYSETSKKFYLSLQLGMGVNYTITNQFKIFLSPSFQYFIKKTENGFPINGNFYNIGVQIGILYSLKQ